MNYNEEPEEEFVEVRIPFYDLDSGEPFIESYSVPLAVADYMQELSDKYHESELVCKAVLESAATTKILNEILVKNMGRN